VVSLAALLLAVSCERSCPSHEQARLEEGLRFQLLYLRQPIHDFRADKLRSPESLEELVLTKYIRKIPVDPLARSASAWRYSPGSSSVAPEIRSGAAGRDCAGTPYAAW
jgi:general secretion pathway protein G